MFRFALIFVALPTIALAGPFAPPDRISVLLGSHHVGANEPFEEFNPGLFLDWQHSDDVTFGLGIYRNSYGRTSVAATTGWQVWSNGTTALDLFGGLAHYPVDGPKSPLAIGDVVPIGGVKLRHRNFVALAIPGDGVAADLVLGFGLTMTMD